MSKRTTFLRQENISYIIMGLLLLLAPLLSEWLAVKADEDISFQWIRIFIAWRQMAPFILVFLIHNWLLAPQLVVHHRRGFYFGCVAVLVVLFTVYECTTRPPLPDKPKFHPHQELHVDGYRPHHHGAGGHKHHHGGEGRGPRHDFDRRPPLIRGEHDIVAVIVLIMMMGLNIGMKYYFRQGFLEKQQKERERNHLEQQLAYLRYQVNPHFLMNTLNNIHALVDIDPECAQTALVKLSRLLRYALYDAERTSVPFQKEVDFVSNYIDLMRIRFNEQVEVDFSVPSPLPAGNLPPLLFATFVENAFKHGVSYQHPSFVHIAFSVEAGRLHFNCVNSRSQRPTSSDSGGLGLRNVRQRLDLLFPNDYQLDIQDQADAYAVRLDIPLSLS